ncbi:hypothetical protein LTR27_009674 [Elasticomyces elasticus]|nr:hypothetical protein LTR27_009674 [Elasticomyces elasticus]
MRLLNVHTFRFEEYHNELNVPPYVVASHRWQAGTEAMIDDIKHRRNTETKGYKKVEGFAKYIREHIVGVDWLWIDTCCVTQHSTKEVDEAVRAMFRWYANAYVCLAYLADVVDPLDQHEFETSGWHRRGWTLQELLAPQAVHILSRTWDVIGHKLDKRCTNMPTFDVGPSLIPAIAEVARIPESVLYSYEQSGKLTVEEKLTWTVGRDTTKGEDMYYSLLGVFGVDMRLSYGEGRVEAKARLLKKIAKSALTSEPPPFYVQLEQPPRITPRRMAHSQYTGYEHQLKDLECHIPFGKPPQDFLFQTIVVLLGMGGIGKSEMVLQLLKRNKRTLDDRLWAVLWVDCSSNTSARADFKRITTQYKWSVADDNIIDGTRDQLARVTGPLLLVLDNCDDDTVDYGSYVPDNLLATVVLTTRLRAARKYASRHPQDSNNTDHFMHLDGLEPSSATSLLVKVAEISEDHGLNRVVGKIVASLGFHPLAINVAGSAIHERIYSVQEYALVLERQLMDEDLLAQKINATFNVSAQALAASSDTSAQDALALLDILAFMHYQGITEDIFERAWAYGERILSCYEDYKVDVLSWYDDHDEDADGDQRIDVLSPWHVAKCRHFLTSHPLSKRMHAFRTARAHLARLSLITVDVVTGSISLHLLISAWARERLEYPQEAWSSAACVLALSTEENSVLATSYGLYPHIEANFYRYADWPRSKHATSHRRQLCRVWYRYTWQLLRASSPVTLKCCHRLFKQLLAMSNAGPGEENLAEAQCLMGVVYIDNGQPAKALGPLKRVARLRQSLAEDHPDRLRAEDALAQAYSDVGQLAKAVKIFEHVARIRKSLAEDDPDRLASQDALARAYLEDGQVAQAIALYEHLVGVEKTLAEDHSDQLASQDALAGAYLQDGQAARAVELLEHIVRAHERLPEDRTSRLSSQHNLGSAYLDNGQIAQAVELLEHVVQVRETSLAEDHPDRLASQHNLSRAYLDNGQIAQAVQFLEHVVQIREVCLLEDHPERLVSQHELARAYWHCERYRAALDLMQHVVRVQEIILRADHPKRVASEKVLAGILEDMAASQASEAAEMSSQDEAKSERERNGEESEEDTGAGAEASN